MSKESDNAALWAIIESDMAEWFDDEPPFNYPLPYACSQCGRSTYACTCE